MEIKDYDFENKVYFINDNNETFEFNKNLTNREITSELIIKENILSYFEGINFVSILLREGYGVENDYNIMKRYFNENVEMEDHITITPLNYLSSEHSEDINMNFNFKLDFENDVIFDVFIDIEEDYYKGVNITESNISEKEYPLKSTLSRDISDVLADFIINTDILEKMEKEKIILVTKNMKLIKINELNKYLIKNEKDIKNLIIKEEFR